MKKNKKRARIPVTKMCLRRSYNRKMKPSSFGSDNFSRLEYCA